jgi:hypothetical protein
MPKPLDPDAQDVAQVEKIYGPLPPDASGKIRDQRYRLAQAAKLIRVNGDRPNSEHRSRVRRGWQCPECFGVRVYRQAKRAGFLCNGCGCEWDESYYLV